MSEAGSPLHRLVGWLLRNERPLAVLVVLASLLVQANAIVHYGYLGQDFEDHVFKLKSVLVDPLLVVATQDAPLPYYLGAWLYLATGGRHVLEIFAFLTAFMNAAAVLLFHRLAERLIGSALLRLAATVFLAFLPFRLVHSVVFSGDSFTALPFIVVASLVVGLRADEAGREGRIRILALVMTLALLAKHSFVAFLPALFLVLVLLFRTGVLGRRQALTFLGLVILLPGTLGTLLFLASSHATVHPWKRVPGTGPAMTASDLLLPKKQDLHLLSAPSYDEKDADGKYNLVFPHRFSYPALLHLGIFTDLLNFFQYDTDRPYVPKRSAANREKMAVAVKLGIPFSIAALLATLGYTGRAIRDYFRALLSRRAPPERDFALLVAVVFGLAGHLVIVVALPYLRWAYWSGYWLPRLVMPSMMTFFLLSFAALDERLGSARPRMGLAILLLVLAQAALHVSFLWPAGAYGPMPRIDIPAYR